MNRRVPVQEIRGSDPTLLEVQLSEMLRKPLGQLALINVMDLIELAHTDDRPRTLVRGLEAFVKGVSRQIDDTPAGKPFEAFLEELDELEPQRVPHRFREIILQQTERTDLGDRLGARVGELLERWSSHEPMAFEFNARKAKVTRAEVRRRGVAREPSSAPRERRGRSGASARSSGRASATPIADTERNALIQDLCLEKLGRASDNGLGEHVLVAGVRHQAKGRYPDLLPAEVTAVLRSLKDTHRVRYSAGRWSLPTRF